MTITSLKTTCLICHAPHEGDASSPWQCENCGQRYKREQQIDLNERQLAAIRTLGGMDPSGTTNVIENWWTNNNAEFKGEEFLSWNKNSPARDQTRNFIETWCAGKQIKSILEIAFGGLHEFRYLKDKIGDVTYSGMDWTPHFIAAARREFPNNRWQQGDIVRGVTAEPADLVYSQHMLEHVPALEPALGNMLRLAKKKLINIFFLPLKAFDGYEVTNWKQFPLYHNTYSPGHVEHVCRANGFNCQWFAHGEETVLLAERAGS